MRYEKKTVQSRPGLSQEEALNSLQDHPLYRPGTKIASIRRRGDRWVADLLEPKTAGEMEDESGEEEGPPSGGGEPKPKKPAFGEDGGDEGPGDDEGPDGPEDPDAGGDGPPGEGDKKGGEKGEIATLLHLVQTIADALGVSASPDLGMGGPDDLGPGGAGLGGPPAPPHGAPHHAPPPVPGAGAGGPPPPPGLGHPGAGGPPKPPAPLGTPFSSTRTANPLPGGGSSVSVPVPGAAAPAAASGGGQCPHGYPQAGSCPECQAQGGMQAGVPGVVGRTRSFVASQQSGMTIKQAKLSLEATYGPLGYSVQQIKRDGNVVRALLVANGKRS